MHQAPIFGFCANIGIKVFLEDSDEPITLQVTFAQQEHEAPTIIFIDPTPLEDWLRKSPLLDQFHEDYLDAFAEGFFEG